MKARIFATYIVVMFSALCGHSASGQSSELTTTTSFGTTTTTISGLVLHYSFDTDQGIFALDDSGHGHTGIVFSATWISNGVILGACDFDGVNDKIVAFDDDAFSFGNGVSDQPFSVGAWIKMNDATRFRIVNRDSASFREYDFFTDQSDFLYLQLIDDSSNFGTAQRSIALTSYENQWIHVVGTYNGSGSGNGITLYLNGQVLSSSLSDSGPYVAMKNTPVDLWVGGFELIPDYANGSIDEVFIYNKELSLSEVATLFAPGSTTSTTSTSTTSTSSTSSTTTPLTEGIVLQYSFDTDQGIFAVDDSGNGHTGIVFSATWISNGVISGACDFDGVNDKIVAFDDDSLTFGDGTNDQPFSVGAWINMEDATRFRIVNKDAPANREFDFFTDASDTLHLQIIDNSSAGRRSQRSSALTAHQGQWIHLIGTYDGSGTGNGITLYLNGDILSSALSVVGSYTAMENTPADLWVGAFEFNPDYGHGAIDEVIIYDRRLSANAVSKIYAAGSTTSTSTTSSTTSSTTDSTTSSSTSTSTSSTTLPLSEALVLHYTFETDDGSVVNDQSGVGNDGNIMGASRILDGERGWVCSFDGTDDHIVASDAPTLNMDTNSFTLAAFVRSSRTLRQFVFFKNNPVTPVNDPGYGMSLMGPPALEPPGSIAFGSDDNVSPTQVISTNTVNDGTWHHIAGVRNRVEDKLFIYIDGVKTTELEDQTDGSTSNGFDMRIGRFVSVSESWFEGQMDDLRVYRRALSAADIAALNTTTTSTSTLTSSTSTSSSSSTTASLSDGLVLHYTFETDDGGFVSDQSGSDNDGYVSGASRVFDNEMGWVCSFDGLDDFILASNSPSLNMDTNAFTLIANIKTSFSNLQQSIYHKSHPSTTLNSTWYSLVILDPQNIPGSVYFGCDDNITKTQLKSMETVNDGHWHQVAGVRDRIADKLFIYIDGVKTTEIQDNTDGTTSNSHDLRIGRFTSEHEDWFNGEMDNLRIYNRALSASDIATLNTTSTTTSSTSTSSTSTSTTSTSSSTTTLPGEHDVTFNYGGGYFSFEAGDIDPGLTFGHGFLAPGSANGARFDFWMAPDGVVDGTGLDGGCGATTDDPNYAAGGNDIFLGARVLNEDGVDQYQAGAGLDVDSFAVSPALTNFNGPGADGTIAGYGRVFESEIPREGDWYYVGPAEVLRNVNAGGAIPNATAIGRGLGVAGLDPIDGTSWSFKVISGSPTTSTTSTTTTTTTTTSTTTAQQSFLYKEFDDPDGINLVDDAYYTSGRLRLNDATDFEAGYAWLTEKLPLSNGFDVLFRFKIGGIGGTLDLSGERGAGGLAFVIQKVGSSATMVNGLGLPYMIPNALAVEFDTFHNNWVPEDDANGNHISIQPVNSAPTTPETFYFSNSLGAALAIPNMSDGAPHDARIRYTPGFMEVFLDDLSIPVITSAVDLTNVNGINVLSSNGMAWIGFVAGTGDSYEWHDILSIHVRIGGGTYEPGTLSIDHTTSLSNGTWNPLTQVNTLFGPLLPPQLRVLIDPHQDTNALHLAVEEANSTNQPTVWSTLCEDVAHTNNPSSSGAYRARADY